MFQVAAPRELRTRNRELLLVCPAFFSSLEIAGAGLTAPAKPQPSRLECADYSRMTLRICTYMFHVEHFSGGAQRSTWNTRSYSARYTTRPLTMVATTLPVSCQPSNGVLCDFERDLAAANVQRF
jgi:hypothetical protein